MRVAYQGEPGAYGEEAVHRLFGAVPTVQCTSFAGVFEAVQRGDADRGVVPVENSLAGSINETYDLLLAHELVITGELDLRVSHCLMGLPGQTLGQIKKVYSHPQALAQADAYLKRLGAELVPYYNTAGSAKMIREQGLEGCAAVASRRAASLYGLEILAEAIETTPSNYTRFFELSTTPAERVEPSKTSIVFIVRNTVGTLYAALGALATRRVNLIKIESRPARQRPWEYTFYVDVDGHADVEPLRAALVELRQHTTFLRVLGSYPKALPPDAT
ncbi:MAG TPA: prephenate dehydratase [bacterium]|nr:prephenate dehydratase [bacterium]